MIICGGRRIHFNTFATADYGNFPGSKDERNHGKLPTISHATTSK
jgi:hypothetical protein